MRPQKTTTAKVPVDPKEQLVNNEGLEKNYQLLQEKTNNKCEKRSSPSDDDDMTANAVEMVDDQQTTAKEKKKTTTHEKKKTKTNKSSHTNVNPIPVEQSTQSVDDNNKNEQLGQMKISDQAITFAVENNLQPIKIECNPPLKDRDHAKKFVINFLRYINKDFRKEYPGNVQPLGFHHWWIDTGGNKFYGVTNDADLYIYLCDIKHYPTQIDKVNLKPEPPKRLPPQNTLVIKFVQNELCTDEIKSELIELYKSIYAVEDMMGTMRSNTRHIRIEFYQKEEYVQILTKGKISLQGQIFEIEEYLAPPKILICSKCNSPGHTKKVCQVTIDICRRCGEDRSNGDKHDECSIKCHHCGGNHIATDFKCPIIIKFRQELLFRLKTDKNKLPPNIKLFIPVDCRLNGDRNRFLITNNEKKPKTSTQSEPPSINPWFSNITTNNDQSSMNEIDKSINTLVNELAEMKKNFEIEREKMKRSFEDQIKTIKQGLVIIQQQVQAQNQCFTLLSTMIKDNTSAMNQITSSLITLGEAIKTKPSGELDHNKIEMSQLMINSTCNHMKNLNDTYVKYEHELTLLMNKQSLVFDSTIVKLLQNQNE